MTPFHGRALPSLVYRSLIFFGFVDLLSPTLPFIAQFQKMHGLLPLMGFLSGLGTEYFYLALLPIIYWGINRPLGLRLGALLLFSVTVNAIFKAGFAQPRPYWHDPHLLMLPGEKEDSFGFPSGHAQNAFLIWTFLAIHSKNRRLWVSLAVLLSLGISLSRIYLGVHYPTDVLGGAVIGLVILGLYRVGGPAWMRFWRQLSTFQKIIFSFFATAFLGGIYAIAMVMGTNGYITDYGSPSLSAVQTVQSGAFIASRLGGLFGLLIAATLRERLNLKFEARTAALSLVLRYVIGFVVLVVLYVGLDKYLPDAIYWKFFRYAVITFWVVFGAVWVFGKIGINGGKRDALAS